MRNDCPRSGFPDRELESFEPSHLVVSFLSGRDCERPVDVDHVGSANDLTEVVDRVALAIDAVDDGDAVSGRTVREPNASDPVVVALQVVVHERGCQAAVAARVSLAKRLMVEQ